MKSFGGGRGLESSGREKRVSAVIFSEMEFAGQRYTS
jgi:hypothetical protein